MRPQKRAVSLGALALLLVTSARAPAAPALRISGSANLNVSAEPHGRGFELHGSITDEVGRGLESAQLRVEADDASGLAARLQLCNRAEARAELGPLELHTDASGRFCVEVSELREGNARLRFSDPRGFYGPVERTVALSERLEPPFEVGFSPTPAVFPLEQAEQRLRIETRGRGNGQERERELVLSVQVADQVRELARKRFAPGASALELVLPSSSLGEPGPARLLARVSAGESGSSAEASAAILKTVTVKVALAGGKSSFDRNEPLEFEVRSALGPVTGGLVEVERAGRVVAAARVTNGVATVSAWPADAESALTPVRVHYQGAGPGFLAAEPLELWPTAGHRSLGLGWLWILAAAVAASIVASNFRRTPLPAAPAPLPKPTPRAAIELLEEFSEHGGYRGQVRDAHDGRPIAGAVLSILAPGQGALRVLLQVRTGSEGGFVIEAQSFESNARLEVTAMFHASLTSALPKPGVLDLALVARRRALLDRLVRWAEQRGAPWTRDRGEPTPAHVVGAAVATDETEVADWARGVERLAFGEAEPDESAEQALGAEPKTSAERSID